jgi:hypothetical protein
MTTIFNCSWKLNVITRQKAVLHFTFLNVDFIMCHITFYNVLLNKIAFWYFYNYFKPKITGFCSLLLTWKRMKTFIMI